MEKKFFKKQILECYFNIVYFGDGVYGVEFVVYYYFGIIVVNFDFVQLVMLVGLVQNLVVYDLVNYLEVVMNCCNIVLVCMV